ncbi:MAG TPA: DUF2339 domain-containing protein [Candidatus Methylomirabilis sp.]|nr:DUF2339 domain-containing protein [Candidatus Methylomirabilis sp.]
MGVKLFAWLGGLGLFLGVGFFVKYSFEHELIPPEVRVVLGFLAGLALLVAGLRMAGQRYDVTAQTLCATGVVILYAVTFACRSVYHFPLFGLIPTFLLMTLITATAFLLAVRLDTQVVAILGMLAGFLTPVLLSTGQDNPPGLFGYVALLDIGLIAVALHRRWQFLVLFGAVGTILTLWGWAATFFSVPKVGTAIAAFLLFDVLFLAGFLLAHRRGQVDRWVSAAAILPSLASVVFAAYLLTFGGLGQRPGLVFGFVLVADICLLALAWMREELAPLQVGAGMAVFALLAVWTDRHLSSDLLSWGLCLYLLFACFHAALPVALQRLRPRSSPAWWIHLFPVLALLLVMIPIGRGLALSLLVWPVVLLIDLLAVVLAILVPSVLALLAVLLLTVAATGLWIAAIQASVTLLPSMLLVIGVVAVFFLAATVLAARWLPGGTSTGWTGTTAPTPARGPLGLDLAALAQLPAQLPALSAVLPFLLLLMLTERLPLPDPSPVFGLALVLVVLLLGLARWLEMEWLPAVGLFCTLVLEHAWHVQHFQPYQAVVPLLWHLGFYVIFLVFPFVLRPPFATSVVPWAAAALSGPLHFYLVYRVASMAFPNNVMGLLPAAFALPTMAGLLVLLRIVAPGSRTRNALLAWFGGVALFFITLIFPIQFERQWLTITWALEGVALLWLFHRVPNPGLPLTGVGLLLVAFGRLALNPAVLAYHPRSATPILNWYLYAYGIVTTCLFVGARLLGPPGHLLLGWNVPPVLTGLGTVLAFLLMNIEIADYFTVAGSVLTFQFAGNLAQDMTYSIAWALFALALIVVGLAKRLALARYAGLGLLGLTLLKLFVHDLARLAQLYRIGALLCVAIIAIFASFLYQRWLVTEENRDAPGATQP